MQQSTRHVHVRPVWCSCDDEPRLWSDNRTETLVQWTQIRFACQQANFSRHGYRVRGTKQLQWTKDRLSRMADQVCVHVEPEITNTSFGKMTTDRMSSCQGYTSHPWSLWSHCGRCCGLTRQDGVCLCRTVFGLVKAKWNVYILNSLWISNAKMKHVYINQFFG